jgi:hypothetical protein
MSLYLDNVYFNGLIEGRGLLTKSPVLAATTENITLSNTQTIDGVSVNAGDRVLVKNQTTASQNGIYNVVASGAWTRSEDLQVGDDASSISVCVLNGTVNFAKVFTCTNASGAAVVGTNNLAFDVFITSNHTQTLTNKTLDSTNTTFQSGASTSKQATLDLTGLSAARSYILPDFSGTLATIATAQTFTDKTLIVDSTVLQDATTSSKQAKFDASGLTGTKTFAFPALTGASDTLVVKAEAQTLTNKTLVAGSTTIQDATDTTKQAKFSAASITTGTTRTYTLPDRDGTLATQEYVDGVAQGLIVKDAVRVATVANGTLASAFAAGQVVDGVTLVAGDRVLLKNQSTASENGIYVVNASGAPTRADDFNNTNDGKTNGEVRSGAFCFVSEGSVNADSGWVLTTDGSITLGSTDLAFTQFSGAGSLIAGDALYRDGNTLHVAVTADSGIEISGDSLRLNLGASAILGTLATGDGGTGLTSFTANRFLYSTSSSALDASTKAVPSGDVLGTSDTQTLSNKSLIDASTYFLNTTDNTKRAVFSAASITTGTTRTYTLPDVSDTIVTLTATQTLTNKTLTAPKIDQINDTNGNAVVILSYAASAVNQLTVSNAAASGTPSISATGTDSNIDLRLAPKGTGSVVVDSGVVKFSKSGVDPELRLFSQASGNYVGLKVPSSVASSLTFTLPAADGANGQFLKTNGSGAFSFASIPTRASYAICSTASIAPYSTGNAVAIATSNFVWQNSKYGTSGTYGLQTGRCTYHYTADASVTNGTSLTVEVFNTTTGLALGSESVSVNASTASAREFSFTVPTADARLQLRVKKDQSAGVLTVSGGTLEFDKI